MFRPIRIAFFAHRSVLVVLTIAVCCLSLPTVVEACPNCKDALAADPASAGLVRGYAASIMFMLTMPFLIFSSLCTYFYLLVRRARAQNANSSPSALVIERQAVEQAEVVGTSKP